MSPRVGGHTRWELLGTPEAHVTGIVFRHFRGAISFLFCVLCQCYSPLHLFRQWIEIVPCFADGVILRSPEFLPADLPCTGVLPDTYESLFLLVCFISCCNLLRARCQRIRGGEIGGEGFPVFCVQCSRCSQPRTPFASWPCEPGFTSATLTCGFLCLLHFLAMVVAKVEGEIRH